MSWDFWLLCFSDDGDMDGGSKSTDSGGSTSDMLMVVLLLSLRSYNLPERFPLAAIASKET